MTTIDRLGVDLGPRSYDIHVGPDLVSDAARYIGPFVRHTPVIVVTDETVAALHLATLTKALDDAEMAHTTIVVPAGEHAKAFDEFERLIEAILDTAPERGSLIVALGGGVVGDLAGFAASVALRGIDFVQIPTTLLAQVDSSVGGKTAINSRRGKNLIGAFYQPRVVLADTGVLATLPRRELLAGYAEVVKYGLINDPAFFEWLEENGERVYTGDADALRHAVTTSCAAKAAIVAEDEHEQGKRALLNLGHTFGHALEAETGYGAVLHGEAVSVGMALAFDLSVQMGLCPPEDALRVRRHLAHAGLPTGLDAVTGQGLSPEALIAHMRSDKKVQGGELTFILTRGIGQAFVAKGVDVAEVDRLLRRAIAA